MLLPLLRSLDRSHVSCYAPLHSFTHHRGSPSAVRRSRFYQSASLRDALLGSSTGTLAWFLREQPQDTSNWWYQMIGCGRPLAQLSLQFQSLLSAEGVANATALMDRAQWVSWTSTGTNAADIAVVHIGNGLVNGNDTYVAEASVLLPHQRSPSRGVVCAHVCTCSSD